MSSSRRSSRLGRSLSCRARDTQSLAAGARDLLRDIAQMSDAEWAAIGRGEAVAKVLATDNREIAVAGAVRIASSSERLVGRYRDIESLKRSAIVLEIGRFSKPPRPADLAAVPIEDYNLDLRDCWPGDCRVRLGEPAIARFHREVDWRAADWRERSSAVWREVLAGYAADYSPRRPARAANVGQQA